MKIAILVVCIVALLAGTAGYFIGNTDQRANLTKVTAYERLYTQKSFSYDSVQVAIASVITALKQSPDSNEIRVQANALLVKIPLLKQPIILSSDYTFKAIKTDEPTPPVKK